MDDVDIGNIGLHDLREKTRPVYQVDSSLWFVLEEHIHTLDLKLDFSRPYWRIHHFDPLTISRNPFSPVLDAAQILMMFLFQQETGNSTKKF